MNTREIIKNIKHKDLLIKIDKYTIEETAKLLCFLEKDKDGIAPVILAKFPPADQVSIIVKIAQINELAPQDFGMLDELLTGRPPKIRYECGIRAGGTTAAANILYKAGRDAYTKILDEIAKLDPQMEDKILEGMPVFKDIVLLDDNSIRKMLSDIENKELAMALKSADKAVQDCIFRNLERKRVFMIKEDMDFMGPVRLADVLAAQGRIGRIIFKNISAQTEINKDEKETVYGEGPISAGKKFNKMLCYVRLEDRLELEECCRDIPLIFADSVKDFKSKITNDSYLIVSLYYIAANSNEFLKIFEKFQDNVFHVYGIKPHEKKKNFDDMCFNLIKGQYNAKELRENYLGNTVDLETYSRIKPPVLDNAPDDLDLIKHLVTLFKIAKRGNLFELDDFYNEETNGYLGNPVYKYCFEGILKFKKTPEDLKMARNRSELIIIKGFELINNREDRKELSLSGFADILGALLENPLRSDKILEKYYFDKLDEEENRRYEKEDEDEALQEEYLYEKIWSKSIKTIARIFICLNFNKAQLAAKVLKNFSLDTQISIITEVAQINELSMQDYIKTIEFITNEPPENTDKNEIPAEGAGIAGWILNNMGYLFSAESIPGKIIDEIEKNDPQLADRLIGNVFILEDVVCVNEYACKKAFKSVNSNEFAIVLQDLDSAIQELIFRRLGKKRELIIKEKMQNMEAISEEDIEKTKRKIAAHVFRLLRRM